MNTLPKWKRNLKIVILPDVHIPHNIDLAPVEKFMGDFKPDVLIYLGDFMNLDAVSHWIADKTKLVAAEKLADDYKIAQYVIDKHREIVGPNCRLIYFKGNHENWLEQYLEKFPQFEGLIELENNLSGIDEYVPFNEVYKIGHLYFLHGMWTNLYHAAKHLNAYMCNLIYGHTHDIQEFSKIKPQDHMPMKAKSIGCLCRFDMPYMKKRPSNWVNAFGVAYIRKDGTFNEYTVNIIDGKFTFNGKTY